MQNKVPALREKKKNKAQAGAGVHHRDPQEQAVHPAEPAEQGEPH